MENKLKENTVETNLTKKLINEFQAYQSKLNGDASGSLNHLRTDAMSVFEKLGFPVKKMEEWKYTNLSPVMNHDFEFSSDLSVSGITRADINKYIFSDGNVNRLVFINGIYSRELSSVISNNEKIFIGSISDSMKNYKEIFEKHYSKYADYKNRSLAALNTAFSPEGAFIYLKKNTELDTPVHILNISDSKIKSVFSQPRNLIVIEEGSKIYIAEDYYSAGDNFCFTNMVTEIFCGKNSHTEHYKIQNEDERSFHVGMTQIHQEQDSHYSNTTISWGGSIIRNDLNSVFDGTNTESHFFGLYLLSGKQHVDNHTLADHKMPNCYSNELYKGIIGDNATGVFNGKIMVREDAQKTNAYQSNGNILLSDDATIYSKPQLEIFADDVKCSHGATSGQLNQDEMFYIKSRGIGDKDAKSLLLKAFASDVIDSIKIDEFKNIIEEKMDLKLKNLLK
ncbi:MAG TPA: Fe-S cluster assembly protein SufD [Ignavibacteria bacterium]|nr:Fe-S cluster assembly protein SufD [Bacteroidota bacterium]HRI84685.1 Fe-S cluster assembly protein SufD [Ignavibacteria bacterium]HRK00234.1 Fe-S cluster assembly protein SufD [Ignavibacteria bacterium]